ncbi:D-amino-acid transaminase [Pseudalkalibacillus hwajinpoensis]|uniref:D-alanine aminotransferase n=1 Tax=Guptibacillus hwajinpoensis TaxID=208199 RepID=A0A4U1MLH4_9BACL|nr:D-amino-acid transaminase [Pseudalkalibacillus hwajinpoensis]TKD71564.1 D-amino-acid transaminase [Pseudalkalibacillus hwajinpoensis]
MILLNDELISKEHASIDIEDRGYQFGDGVYEVVRIYNGQFFELDAHLERLGRSAGEIKITLPFSITNLKERIEKLMKFNNVHSGHLYLQVTRGVSPRNHAFPENAIPVLVAYTKEYKVEPSRLPGRAMFTDDIRWLRCDIKSLNLLGNVLAKEDATEKGFDEAIFHRGEIVTEGSSTNVFLIRDRVLYTHPANHLILDGITRRKIVSVAVNLGIQVKEESFTKQQLLEADEVFISSTTQEVRPIIEVDGHTIGNGKEGDVTASLQAEFELHIPRAEK